MIQSQEPSTRRRRLIVVGAAVAVLATAGVVVALLRSAPDLPRYDAHPVRAAPAAPQPVDIVIGEELFTTDGRRITLPTGAVLADRVPAGWIVRTYRGVDGGGLWLIAGDTVRELVADAADAADAVVAPDGRSVAFRQGNWITVAAVTGDGLAVRHRTRVDGTDLAQGRRGVILHGWVGDTLLLSHVNPSHAADDGDGLWDPATGDYDGTPQPFAALHGSDHVLLGTVQRDGRACLVAVRGSASKPTLGPPACGIDVMAHFEHAVSPDGRYVLGLGSGAGAPMRLYDVARGVPVADLPARQAEPVWLTADTVLTRAGDGQALLRVSTADPGHPVRIPLPEPAAGRWSLVARHGVPV
ncbi:hypothetical protein R8Z50_20600 [Longispora sp. K20-0274]|uniref:hypothetical protein n=1 Tax=Longispora sp. K20-0274 TaxID=3088255 RepID=UPI00399C00A3